jgi:hypothetical protein
MADDKRLDALLRVRMRSSEVRQIQQAAEDAGLPVSALVRQIMLSFTLGSSREELHPALERGMEQEWTWGNARGAPYGPPVRVEQTGSVYNCRSNVGYGQVPSGRNQGMPKQRKTSVQAGKAASRVLRDGRTSKDSKRAAGSALSQRAPKGGKKKG